MSGMRIYLAAAYQRKQEVREAAAALRAVGFEITSRWSDEPFDPLVKLGDFDDETLRRMALIDLLDIESSDALILFTEPADKQPPRGSRHVEFGFALADYKRLFLIGPRENLFHYLPGVRQFNSLQDFIAEVPK